MRSDVLKKKKQIREGKKNEDKSNQHVKAEEKKKKKSRAYMSTYWVRSI